MFMYNCFMPMVAYTGSAGKGCVLRPKVCERVWISLVEVYKRVGKSVIWGCERVQKG